MAFFDKLGEMTRNAADMVSDNMEITRIQSDITMQQGNINVYQRELGMYYWSKYLTGIQLDEEAMHICDKIVVAQERIHKLEAEIESIKATRAAEKAERAEQKRQEAEARAAEEKAKQELAEAERAAQKREAEDHAIAQWADEVREIDNAPEAIEATADLVEEDAAEVEHTEAEKFCRYCGAAVTTVQKFCGECGESLS